MTIDPKHLGQIEAWLHRPLTDEELRPASSLDMLSDDQVAVVAAIQPHNRIAPMLFLQAVVPTAKRQDVVDYIDNIDDVYVVRRPPPQLPDQRIFEHYAGRPLEPAERVRAGTVYKMTSAQVELAKTFALKDLTVAFLYLSRIAPEETIEQRHYVAKHLAASYDRWCREGAADEACRASFGRSSASWPTRTCAGSLGVGDRRSGAGGSGSCWQSSAAHRGARVWP